MIKMSKAEATRFFKSLLGSGAGTWEVTAGREYAVRNGQIVYMVEVVSNWPFGAMLQMTAFIADRQIINNTLFNRDTHLPWDDQGDRKKVIASIQRSIENRRD